MTQSTEKQSQDWIDPVVPPKELSRPYDVQAVLRKDTVAPAATLLEASDYDLGTAPVDVDRYISKKFHDLEVEKVWSRTWQYACWSYDVPKPGDVAVYRIASQSVIVVRQRDLSLKAFFNTCLHRGRELCQSDTWRNQLRCPYHGFTWSLAGDLAWVPSQWDFPQVTPDNFKLPQVRVDEWNGFVFVNFDAAAPSLQEYMGAMYSQWGGDQPKGSWDFKSKYKAVHLERVINCNWKVCMEAFMESLHVASSHPQMTPTVPESSAQYDVYPNEPHFSRFHTITGMPSSVLHKVPSPQDSVDALTGSYLPEYHKTEFGKIREGESTRLTFGRLSRQIFKDRLGMDVSNLSEAELIDGTEYFLFPNFLPWPSVLNPLVYRFRPAGNDPDWSIWETMLFLPFEGERPPSCEVIHMKEGESFEDYKKMGALDRILQQDAVQLPLVQAGLKGSATRKVTLARYQEARLRHYNQTLDDYIAR
ncbi:MAG TPA: aromatic ring-hydroxylating dioxygenase subunit alpha [Steroidobacteraceae bacterium]|jgi:phenylpropionate dioxygenase-like ring-hydroxylating dioxygenase large terminal subunit